MCVYDASSDQRRKIAIHRSAHDLQQALDDLSRTRLLLGGIIATIRVGSTQAIEDLIQAIRSGIDLSQLAAHVRNELRSNHVAHQAFDQLDFTLDGPPGLPSPTQLLADMSYSSSRESASSSLPDGPFQAQDDAFN